MSIMSTSMLSQQGQCTLAQVLVIQNYVYVPAAKLWVLPRNAVAAHPQSPVAVKICLLYFYTNYAGMQIELACNMYQCVSFNMHKARPNEVLSSRTVELLAWL